MALISCPECSKKISDTFNNCVFCGNTKRNEGIYTEELESLSSLRAFDGKCCLIITKSNWKIEYSFVGRERRNYTYRTSVTIHGDKVDNYIDTLRKGIAQYLTFNNLIPKNIEDYYENSDCRLLSYQDDSAIFSIGLDVQIRVGGFLSGVCIDDWLVRIETESELEDIIHEWNYGRERAMVVMPFLKIL